MTDDQVNLVVQHLCEQLHLALRLKDSEAHPPNAKDIGFDPASVRTVLLTGSAFHRRDLGSAQKFIESPAIRKTSERIGIGPVLRLI